MNYFPFHVGDYAAHTAHLEPMEDLAYRRMLDLYYLREECLPADVAAVARLVRLRSCIQDIETVLNEFFVLTDAGWAHSRCDDEIRRMREKLDASDEKDQHEKDRMQRYRERRAAMFAALRDRGIVPAYDVAMKDLQRLFDEHCNAPETPRAAPAATPATMPETPPKTPATEPATHLQREQAVSGDALATAISTNTNTNTNTNKGEEGRAPRKRDAPTMAPQRPDGVDPQVWSDWLTLRKKKNAPVTETVLSEAEKEAAKAGLALDAFLRVWCVRGSQGLCADWLKPNELGPARGQPVNKQEALEQRGQSIVDEWASEGAAYAAV